MERAPDDLVIDGHRDTAWRSAAAIRSFAEPGTGRRSRRTRAALLWDDDALYLIAEVRDRHVRASATDHDAKLWHGDVVELFLEPSPGSGTYEIQVNPAGAVLDVYWPPGEARDFGAQGGAHPFHIDAAVVVRGTVNHADRDRGWTAEVRIPWSDLAPTGGRPAPGDTWRFHIGRYDHPDDGGEPALTTSAPMTAPDFHRTEQWSPLVFR